MASVVEEIQTLKDRLVLQETLTQETAHPTPPHPLPTTAWPTPRHLATHSNLPRLTTPPPHLTLVSPCCSPASHVHVQQVTCFHTPTASTSCYLLLATRCFLLTASRLHSEKRLTWLSSALQRAAEGTHFRMRSRSCGLTCEIVPPGWAVCRQSKSVDVGSGLGSGSGLGLGPG